jgi:hypothetical protein
MSLTLALWLCSSVPAAPLTTLPPPDNLGFTAGTLAGWEGEGFDLTPGSGRGPTLHFGVSSCDRGTPGKRGLRHLTFQLPETAGVIRFRAYAMRGKDHEPEGALDALLMASGKRIIPKQVRLADGWKTVARVLRPAYGKPREYIWHVAAYAGQTVRIVLADEDPRPGCHLFCSGFQIVPADAFDIQEFSQFMLRLVRDHRLPPVARFESKHFIAVSNADDHFTEHRLNNCELLYDLFFDYFGRRGFSLREPPGKLMVAIFDSQAGFEAYLGQRMSSSVTGIYHTGTNRLLVYDYGQNNAFVAQKRHEQAMARRIGSDLHRRRHIETVNRQAQEFRTEANIGTIMHEVAHQLSFNTGMLDRDGDVPFWVGEGLACFCEATVNGSWQGIGEMNPERLEPLVGPVHGHGHFIGLHDLIARDDWLQPKPNLPSPLLVYAQSWALFRMLMQERPQQLRYYLALMYNRRTPERRIADFTQAFGSDLPRLELRYHEYMKELVERYPRPRR